MCLRFIISNLCILTVLLHTTITANFSLIFADTLFDIQREFGDLKDLRVVEISSSNSESFLSFIEKSGCASYKLLNLDKSSFSSAFDCDLLICTQNIRKEFGPFIEKIIAEVPYGYLSGITDLDAELIVKSLLTNKRKGFLIRKMPSDLQIIWQPAHVNFISSLHHIPKLIDPSLQSAVTYDLNGGRVGDSLISYFHAKWIAMEYGLPFLYIPFPDSDTFCLSDNDQSLDQFTSFKHAMTISNKKDVAHALPSTLITVPYFPDCQFEYLTLPMNCAFFPLQWNDPKFNQEVRTCLQPKHSITAFNRPKDCIAIAVHVRRGGTWDIYDWISPILPLKFPPDSYYIEQIQRVARIFPNQTLYVYIFTDDLNPALLASRFAQSIQNPNLKFDWNRMGNVNNKFKDFYAMSQFDCLIRPTSNFSLMADQLGDLPLIIFPTHCHFAQGEIIVDEIKLQFNGESIILPIQPTP